jgi:hypothetical protein
MFDPDPEPFKVESVEEPPAMVWPELDQEEAPASTEEIPYGFHVGRPIEPDPPAILFERWRMGYRLTDAEMLALKMSDFAKPLDEFPDR